MIVKEVQKEDIPLIVNYWNSRTTEQLNAMGIDEDQRHTLNDLGTYIETQLHLPYSQKSALFLVGFINNIPMGHCYVNGIEFGKEANMHLHIWNTSNRQKGVGTVLVAKSVAYFFDKLNIEVLFCEPAASNTAPNKTLSKVGFIFEKKYTTVPSGWNFHLEVNRWVFTKRSLHKKL